jgi:hypothetical protein
VLAATAAAALALTATATAAGGRKVKMTAADQAAARISVLSPSDMGSGWTRHPVKPDLTTNSGLCKGFAPKESDLVVTGATSVKYTQVGAVVEAEAVVMRTEKMLQRDWQRTIASPKLLPCLRTLLKKQSTAKTRFVSIRPLRFPSVAAYTSGWRIRMDVKTKAGKLPMVLDIITFGRGRTELTLSTTMPLESVPTLFPNEIVWAKTLAGRARA